jgi:hypothetical protein
MEEREGRKKKTAPMSCDIGKFYTSQFRWMDLASLTDRSIDPTDLLTKPTNTTPHPISMLCVVAK